MQQQKQTVQQLLSGLDQSHILQAYNSAQVTLKQKLHQQLLLLNQTYPGGLKHYYERAKKLVKDSANSVNPYDDYDVSIPQGIKLQYKQSNLDQIAHYQKLGMKQIQNTAFVLVAGGLGQRLGYPGIKIAIPFELLTRKTFIQYYVEYILAFQNKFCSQGKRIPLLIMTSGDTHKKTVQLLQANNYFGMQQNQIIIVKQQKVPAITDNQAHFSLINEPGILQIQTKPHGHGDIHTLLYLQGQVKRWHDSGIKWIVYFQDTNPLSFRCYLALLGVTAEKNFEFNSISVNRKPGEAVGAITSLVHKQTKKSLTVNVQYNQLKGLFEQSGGQKTDQQGFSLYPGNINSFVINAAKYNETLTRTKGQISEFINPKYADETKTKFKSSARLQCLMQDYPKLLQNCDRVGYTSIDKGFCFSTLKNDSASAKAKYHQGLSSQSAGSCEAEFYYYNRQMLRLCGAEIQQADKCQYGGIALPIYPMVSINPTFATCITEMRDKVKKLKITKNSSLIINNDCIFEDLTVDGHYETKNSQNKSIKAQINNKQYKKIKDIAGQQVSAYITIRGYDLQ